ncbi:MAG: hypothetical protein LBH76_05065 [Propionibacteriaceae bacterium]|jgi:hypothetical protein|nr:hypothetical protein [Propionibacteriaceae bacterium]
MAVALAVTLAGVGLVVALRLAAPPAAAPLEGYGFLAKAVEATNALPAFQSTVQVGSEATLTSRANTMDITGVLDLNRETGKANLLLKTVGKSGMDAAQDFDVTTRLFSDGEQVYELAGGRTKESAMSAAEFREACDGYRIELFAPESVRTQSVSIAADEDGASTLVYYLAALPAPVLASVVEQYETLLGETVAEADIAVTKAQFAYVVQGGLVISQNIQIATEYQSGVRAAAYQTVSAINLTQSREGYDFSLPPLPPAAGQ